ncbi:MAG: hypothetical protein A2015_14830 [Spirochaetes bacterium GWF1_31_7]|nr:MAG: hypothetical protein A2Y30_12090 [Spirochaetes bacterium GWE1_32_154]OHD49423.1 MAG: hypothetical protein A2015_14830 [Spirochaetes bacterium GWF1_31_7]OHD51556.1 MAG: hypothetical protein A2Y29_15350 [Spirochaetes bacterium GWE2_31_10]OHD82543.1 MAG: hypothetical protein A2355_06840 [Spirochaetes bacterium RIFOXYB1_FULL_32_8]HBD93618.1 hypothetical protein [Spirochaetia bacterium]
MNTQITKDFKDIIYHEFGINFSVEKNFLLECKIKRLIQKEEYKSIEDFYKIIKSGEKNSMEILIKYITTNHTFFFREKDHLDKLSELILKSTIKCPVIWCAASSSGEEVYSIIISLLENDIKNFLIIASDINNNVLQKMHKGIYNIGRLFETSPSIKAKYFKKIDDTHYQIRPDLRNFISIKKINLINPMYFVSQFDYIFCKNVLIYFDSETQKKAIKNIMVNLKVGGFLFIGHTETLLNTKMNVEKESNSVYKYLGA